MSPAFVQAYFLLSLEEEHGAKGKLSSSFQGEALNNNNNSFSGENESLQGNSEDLSLEAEPLREKEALEGKTRRFQN